MTQDPEHYAEIFREAVAKVFDNHTGVATPAQTSSLVGMEEDELSVVIQTILYLTREQIGNGVDSGHLDPDDKDSMYDAICVNSAATAMIMYRAITKGRIVAQEDKYPVTVLAEAHIRNMMTDQADLNTVWPIPLAEEVAKEFDPTHAFMVGVVCGSSHG